MADKPNILDLLVDAIAEAVVAKLKAEGATVTGNAAPAETKTDKAASGGKGGKGKDKAPEPPKVDRDAVYEKVKALGERDGKPAARKLIQEYGENFGAVSDDDLPKLLADVEAALAAEKDEDL